MCDLSPLDGARGTMTATMKIITGMCVVMSEVAQFSSC